MQHVSTAVGCPVRVFLNSTVTGEHFVMIYSINKGRYYTAQGFTSSSDQDALRLTSSAVEQLNVQTTELPRLALQENDYLLVKLFAPDGSTPDYSIVTVGTGESTPSNMLLVYGTLKGVLGDPLQAQVIEFTAQQQGVNPFRTPVRPGTSAYVVTDQQGYFFTQLNRAHDYTVVAPSLGITRVLRASQVPSSQLSVELFLNTDLPCAP